LERLLLIGFQKVGDWMLGADRALTFSLDRHAPYPHTLYAFINDGTVMYVGKTDRRLRTRLEGYVRPSENQSGNRRNQANIRTVLLNGGTVEIYALPEAAPHHIGPFHLNLAAGLEDSIVDVLDPLWNGGRKDTEWSDSGVAGALDEQGPASETFPLVVELTYYRTGFFNVGIENAGLLGSDGQVIEIFAGSSVDPILGTINRTANRNGTPRIMGGTRLRDWFQATVSPKDVVRVAVLSGTSIRITPDVQA
jgi:hypothetical protein